MYRGKGKKWSSKKRGPESITSTTDPSPRDRKAVRFSDDGPPVAPAQPQPEVADSDDDDGDDAFLLGEGESGEKEPKLLCLFAPNGCELAAAWFEQDKKVVYVVEDTKDNQGWDLAILLVEQVQPDKVLMSQKAPDSLIDRISEYCDENPSTTYILLPMRYFKRVTAAYAVSDIVLPDNSVPIHETDIDPGSSESERLGRLSHPDNKYYAGMGKLRMSIVKMGCRINVHAPNAIAATGGMLAYMSNHGYAVGPSKRIELEGLESAAIERYMQINQDALTLFGLLNNCVTPLGKKLLYLWHLRPLLDLRDIASRHNAIDLFNDPENQFASEEIIRLLKHICNMSTLMSKIRRGAYRWNDWRKLMDCLTAAIEIKEKVASIGITEAIDEDLRALSVHISQIIDFDFSRDENRVCIRPGIDDELDLWRADYASLDGILVQVAAILRPKVLEIGLGPSVQGVYFPQLGHLASVQEVNLSVRIPPTWEWELRFMTGGVAHYKCPEMRGLDDHFGDISSKISDRETEHAERLCEALKLVERQIQNAVEALAELDCLLALALAARKFGLVRPLISDKPVLEIHGGRHLLQEICIDRFVANDTLLHGGTSNTANSMMMVTGANGSGKSAYGKQVAIITIMAQMGSFVPAQSARIGICDKIFTRVQTRESVSRVKMSIDRETYDKAASAFMIDLSQVSLALRGSTQRSLIILDEFGKGTTPADGAGLLAGVVEYLLTGPRPRTVVLTHFHELFANSFLPTSLPITFCHMQTLIEEGDEGITFLFKLQPTVSLTSSAAECALLHGIPEEVVERGRFVTDCISKFEVSKIYAESPLKPEQEREIKLAEEIARKFLKWQIPDGALDVALQLQDLLDSVLKVDDEEASTELEERNKQDDNGQLTQVHDQDIQQEPEYQERSEGEFEQWRVGREDEQEPYQDQDSTRFQVIDEHFQQDFEQEGDGGQKAIEEDDGWSEARVSGDQEDEEMRSSGMQPEIISVYSD